MLQRVFIEGIVLSSMLVSHLAVAQVGDVNRNWLLIGADLFFQNKSDVTSPEVENSGLGVGVKGVFTRYKPSYIWDLGLGYRADRMKKDNVEVSTNAFFGEAGIRYRLNSRWSLGPQVHLLLGRDVSFSDVGTNSDDKSQSFFGGVRLMRDSLLRDSTRLLRLGLQFATDFNISDRQVSSIQGVVEFGWPWKRSESSSQAQRIAVAPRKKAKVARLKLNLRNAGVNFKTGSAELVGNSYSVIKNLSSVLKKYESEWEEVRIEGHTDVTGNYEKNVELSHNRAGSVRNEFISQGISDAKILSQGFGPDRPLDSRMTNEAHNKNRRVELHLVGDRASRAFVNELERILPPD